MASVSFDYQMNKNPLEKYLLGELRHPSQRPPPKGAKFTSAFGAIELQAAQEWGITPDAYYRLPRDTRAMMTAKVWVDNFQSGVRNHEHNEEAKRRNKRGGK